MAVNQPIDAGTHPGGGGNLALARSTIDDVQGKGGPVANNNAKK